MQAVLLVLHVVALKPQHTRELVAVHVPITRQAMLQVIAVHGAADRQALASLNVEDNHGSILLASCVADAAHRLSVMLQVLAHLDVMLICAAELQTAVQLLEEAVQLAVVVIRGPGDGALIIPHHSAAVLHALDAVGLVQDNAVLRIHDLGPMLLAGLIVVVLSQKSHRPVIAFLLALQRVGCAVLLAGRELREGPGS